MRLIVKPFAWTKESNFSFALFHRLLGLIYIVAAFPLLFQIIPLIGESGLLPAKQLLEISYHHQGYVLSFMQFPSLFHFFPFDGTLLALTGVCSISGLFLIFNIKSFYAALVGWFSFLSVTTIGGDFFVIIIDLFLSEVGFLAVFSTYYLSRYQLLPKIIIYVFLMLNFKLWFCMGINKFYMPLDVWKELTFFDYFFHAQPMPTPLAPIFNQAPNALKKIAIFSLFIAEIPVPFFVFGGKFFRRTAFIVFFLTSVLIQLNGNYGYFNLLSIVLSITILKDEDFPFSVKISESPNLSVKSPSFFVKIILCFHLLFQIFQCLYIFYPNQHSYQNHFNHFFSQIKTENRLIEIIFKPFQWIEYWRICNPYGVFKGIPYYHGEIRLSGSQDGQRWETYEFKYVPSAYTDYLGFFAPYYPRLDHLMFYETLAAQNYRWNLLNRYYNENNSWICNFINKLLNNDTKVSKLLKRNPFLGQQSPVYIKAEIFRLQFSYKKGKNWSEQPVRIIKLFTKNNPCQGRIISIEEAFRTIYFKEE
jgi:hypothetical protein